jgi:hypothetical protein
MKTQGISEIQTQKTMRTQGTREMQLNKNEIGKHIEKREMRANEQTGIKLEQ